MGFSLYNLRDVFGSATWRGLIRRIVADFASKGKYPLPYPLLYGKSTRSEIYNDNLTQPQFREWMGKVVSYFQKAGKEVSWQKLGADFKDHVFRFQILDEAQSLGRNWQDQLADLLAE